jgi:ribosomal protein S18 acetylase RimI-like enzyme
MPEHLVKAHGLTQAQLAQIRSLAEACDAADGITMRLNWRTLERRPSSQVNDLLYHSGGPDDDSRLIGFLGLYQFQPDEAEATAMTDPAHRRRGIFKRLLAEAQGVLSARSAASILFFADHRSPAAAPVARAVGMAYEHTEYLMRAQPAEVRLSAPMPGLTLSPATYADLAYMARLDQEGFGVPAAGNAWLERALDDPEQHLWVVMANGRPVGKIHGRVTHETNFIFGFVIDAAARGRGYGRDALSEAMRLMRSQRDQPFELEVMTTNEHALALYQSHGFAVVTAYDYCRLAVPATAAVGR